MNPALRSGLLLLVAWMGPGLLGAQEVLPGAAVVVEEAKPMTESLSRQFVVHGGDLKLRGAVAGLAEETKTALEKQVGAGDGWKHTIVIQLREQPEGDKRPRSLVPSFYKMANGFRLQLDVYNLDRGLNQDELEGAVLSLLLHERSLRGRDPEGFEDSLSLPWWLKEGLLESFRWARQEADQELYEALFQSKSVFSVDRLLGADDLAGMGAGERAAFRASAGALVMALLNQQGGKEGMAGMLGEAAVFQGEEEALLKQHFPGMNLGLNSLEKWWALQLARMAERSVTETMDVLETEAALTRTLLVRVVDPAGALMEFQPEQFRDLLAIPAEERGAVIQQTSDALSLLAYRAFPGYRPILVGYLTVLGDLKADRDAEIEARLGALSEQRAEMVAMGKRVRDLLEWYKINTAENLSGQFDDYLKLKTELEADRSEYRSPIADYLRGVQAVYDRE